MICPICKDDRVVIMCSLYDDRYAYPEAFSLYRCILCGHKFLDAHFTPAELGELYSKYYPRSAFNIENYRPHREERGFVSWLDGNMSSTFRWVPKNVKVLDIGCGFGESLGYHKARGCEVWGVEADENILRVAEKFGFKAKAGLFDPLDYEKSFFDYVTMDQVIEHVVDPIETMKGISDILKPGGRLVLSTPNSNGWGAKFFAKRWINWHAPYHLHQFSERSIALMAEQAGFEVLMLKTITKSRWLNYQWIHCLFFPKQGEKSVFWSYQTCNPSKIKRTVFKAFSLFHRSGVDHVLTRFFDMLGFGDNYIIILQKKPLYE